MSKLYNVSTSPHVRSTVSTNNIMRDVAIALVPASMYGVYNFGYKALIMMLVCIGFSVLSEFLFEKFMKKTNTIGDLSAVVTGLLIGMNMPVNAPAWMGALGSVFAIVFVKMLYGGIGQNFMNPALAARCFLLISFSGPMSSYVVESAGRRAGFMDLLKTGGVSIDGITGATPLAILESGSPINLLDALIGNTTGAIGETSAIALLIGAIYLLVRKVISWRIPVTYIAVFALSILLFGGRGFELNYILGHVLSGGLMLGALFMATDYSTSPVTIKGQFIFGALLGILTAIFRIFGNSTEGVSYAIIFCNMLVPIIEKLSLPMAFGKGGKTRG